MIYSRDILITGHPRSGTGYCAKLLQANGLDIKHEEMGGMGISSWMFSVDTDTVPFTFDNISPNECQFIHRIQVVRDPVKCISSVYFTETDSEAWRGKFLLLDGNKMERAVRSVIGWNIIHRERANFIFQLEKPLNLLAYLAENNYISEMVELGERVNKRKHEQLSLSDIRDRISPVLYSHLINYIEWYESL